MPKGNMTIVLVILVGAGALLIVSAYENTSLQKTFTNIINNNPLPPAPVLGPQKGTQSNLCPNGDPYRIPVSQQCPPGYKEDLSINPDGPNKTYRICNCCYGGC